MPGSTDFSALAPGLLTDFGWLSESIVATLNDATAASSGSARRVLIVFSEGNGGTSPPGQNVADAAVALGVPIYPVILDHNKYVEHPVAFSNTPGPAGGTAVQARNGDPNSAFIYVNAPVASLLGEMTDGGVYFSAKLDRKKMDDILEGIRDAQLAEYVVGFVPEPSQSPRKRKLEIVLRAKSVGKVVGGRRDAAY